MGEFTITAATVQEIKDVYALIEQAAEPRTRIVLTESKPRTAKETDRLLGQFDYAVVHPV